MYSINYLDQIKDDIEKKIYAERMQYSPIYEIIEKYISEHSGIGTPATRPGIGTPVMVGGTMGINILLQKDRTIDDFSYELYAENAFIHANKMVNQIEDLNQGKYIVFLKTTVPNIKYQISVDGRILVTFIRLSDKSYDLILPVSAKLWDKKRDVLVISPEIQLIDIYRTLYSPNQAEDWETTLKDESKLFKHLQQRIKNSQVGGADQQAITMEDRKTVELQLMKQFVTNNKSVILVGEYALKITAKMELGTTVIQIISQNNIEDDFKEIEKIIKAVLKRNIPVVKMTREMHIMKDFRLLRTTIKMGDSDSGQKEVMYVYNSAQYDLIPINLSEEQSGENFIQIGNPFVLLRFLLIDFWMIRWIQQIGGIDASFAKQRLDSILNKMIALRMLLAKKCNDAARNDIVCNDIDPKYFDSSTFKIFPSLSENYVGFYDDEVISQKLIIKDLSKKFYDYYPSDYFKKNGQYREIESKK